jgi:hypothetical protein
MKALAAAAMLVMISAPATAKDYRVQWVEAVNNVVECKTYHNGWLLTTSGPCSDFKRPDTIAIDESFFAVGA